VVPFKGKPPVMSVSQVQAVRQSVENPPANRPPTPGSLAVVSTDERTCLAVLQTDGSWKEISGGAVVEKIVSLNVLA
jgi:hypothetical protein